MINVVASNMSKVMENLFPKKHTAEEDMITATEVCKKFLFHYVKHTINYDAADYTNTSIQTFLRKFD